jgi:hypothetical protein
VGAHPVTLERSQSNHWQSCNTTKMSITPTASTKYLGVMLDQNLDWEEQLAYVIGKGTKWRDRGIMV